jgi:hypothetical protein
MHLASPALSLNGKSKSKSKFASSAAKQKHLALQQDWEKKQKEWANLSKPSNKNYKQKVVSLSPAIPEGRNTTKNIKSLNEWITGTVSSKPTQDYTGTKIKGISQMAKSNAVPVFNHDHIIEIARMRR